MKPLTAEERAKTDLNKLKISPARTFFGALMGNGHGDIETTLGKYGYSNTPIKVFFRIMQAYANHVNQSLIEENSSIEETNDFLAKNLVRKANEWKYCEQRIKELEEGIEKALHLLVNSNSKNRAKGILYDLSVNRKLSLLTKETKR